MTICWHCYFGWPKYVFDIYESAVKKLNGDSHALHFGPAHIVWEDENWDSVDWCLDNFDKHSDGFSDQELDVVKWSLKELAKIPLDKRDLEPEDYDGENPGNFPPPSGIEMIMD